MKKILCFGDSNTYGFNPIDGNRYGEDVRWSAILKSRLRGKYRVVEAGSNNRTCFIDNSDGADKTGYKALPMYLTSDFDILILAIGINDVQKFYTVTNSDIKNGIQNLINIAKNINQNIKIILFSPSAINECILKGYFSFQFNEKSIKQSYEFANIYKKVAEENDCIFLDLDTIVNVSEIDGLHYNPSEHKKIAQEAEKLILQL